MQRNWLMTFLMQKPEAYGLDKPSLNFLNDCLRFWTQRSKIGSSYNDWANATRCIPWVSIVGPHSTFYYFYQ